MANIVITHFSAIISDGTHKSACFYDGLMKGFAEQGHNVLQVVTSNFLITPWNGTNKTVTQSIKENALKEIKEFKPDLVLSFNNSSIEDLEKEVDCPIVLWDADTFTFFNDKEKIKKNADRYHYVSFANSGIADYKKNLNISDKNICRIPGATEIRAKKIEKRYNISFIGNPFFPRKEALEFLTQNPEIMIKEKDFFLQNEVRWRKFCKTKSISLEEILFYDAGSRRVKMIATLLDLGMHIFGPTNWLSLSPYLIEILNSYDPSHVFSLEHNELVYNRSKMSVNICHSQNVSGYPWRIADILASDSVLLSDYKVDLVKDFGKEVPLQIYHSPPEAYEISKKLLGDTQLREDIIARQNACIEKNFRWKHRFPLLQDLTGVNLEKSKLSPGTHKVLTPSGDLMGDFIKTTFIFFSNKPSHNFRLRKPNFYKRLPIEFRDMMRGIYKMRFLQKFFYDLLPIRFKKLIYVVCISAQSRPEYK